MTAGVGGTSGLTRIHVSQGFQMLINVAVLALVAAIPVAGQGSFGPKYKTYTRHCDDDSECDVSSGEVCWRLYLGCYEGVCMCHPSERLDRPSGRCHPYKRGNEWCASSGDCLDSMTCRNGTCQCLSGELSAEGNFCIQPHHKLLGQDCNPTTDRCFHEIPDFGYTKENVQCSTTWQCECDDGYLSDAGTCRKMLVGDTGCTRPYHCEGGAICLDSRCACPSGYREVAAGAKCAKVNAIVELPLGRHCDELNEQLYCAKGLICHQCGTDRRYKCVQYSLSNPRPVPSASVTCTTCSAALAAGLVIFHRWLLFYCQRQRDR